MQLKHRLSASPLRLAIWGGLTAAIAVMPLGWAFRAAGLRIGHYGPKFAALYWPDPGPPLLFVQHLMISTASALPLAFWLLRRGERRGSPVLAGVAYGALYYALVNALALPLAFGDALPWQLGPATVWPSLVGHMAWGAVIGVLARR